MKINKGRTRIRVKQSVGAATLLIALINFMFRRWCHSRSPDPHASEA